MLLSTSFSLGPSLGSFLAPSSDVDLAASKQIIEAAHPVPAIAIRLEHKMVPAIVARAAMILAEQIDEEFIGTVSQSGAKDQLARRSRPGGTPIFSPYMEAFIDPEAPRGPWG